MSESIHVAVFTHERPGRKPMVLALTRDFNPEWTGYCRHDVAPPRATAKQRAIAEHRARCLATGDGGA